MIPRVHFCHSFNLVLKFIIYLKITIVYFLNSSTKIWIFCCFNSYFVYLIGLHSRLSFLWLVKELFLNNCVFFVLHKKSDCVNELLLSLQKFVRNYLLGSTRLVSVNMYVNLRQVSNSTCSVLSKKCL